MKLIAGQAFGEKSEVEVLWPTVYIDIQAEAGKTIAICGEQEERALYVVYGSIEIDGETVPEFTMAVLKAG